MKSPLVQHKIITFTVVGAACLVLLNSCNSSSEQQSEPLPPKKIEAPVVVVVKNIKAGHKLRAEDLGKRYEDTEKIAIDLITNPDNIVGAVADRDLPAGSEVPISFLSGKDIPLPEPQPFNTDPRYGCPINVQDVVRVRKTINQGEEIPLNAMELVRLPVGRIEAGSATDPKVIAGKKAAYQLLKGNILLLNCIVSDTKTSSSKPSPSK